MSGDSAQAKQVVEARVKIAAPLDRVWSAWTDPARLDEWFPERFEGAVVEGKRVVLGGDVVGLDETLEVVELVSHERLRFRGARAETAAQKLDVAFKDLDGSATMVRLHHAGFGAGHERRDGRDRIASGWQTVIAILRLYVESYFGAAREVKVVLAEADVAFDRLHRYYTDAEYLRRWLTESGGVGTIGETCELVLRDDLHLECEVLSRFAGRSVALSCRSIGGVIVLCASPSDRAGRAGRVGAWICSWAGQSSMLDALEGHFAAAVERLVSSLAE